MTRQEFIDQYSSAAIRSTIGVNLFPSVKLAQAILESGDGNSGLAKCYNNFFGIKAGFEWKGETIDIDTDEVTGGKWVTLYGKFRVYDSPLESFKDHTRLLSEMGLYDSVLKADTPEQQASNLQQSGYATDPGYGRKLIKLIEDHNLKDLDKKKITMKNIDIFIAILMLLIAILTIYKYVKI